MYFNVQGEYKAPLDLNKLVASIEYHKYAGCTTTACALKLLNGFVVMGRSSSAPSVPFDPQLGMQYAHKAAIEKLAELAAFVEYDLTAGGEPVRAVVKAHYSVKEN